MLTDKITTLFNHYLKAFIDYDIEQVRECYHLPCTLHTPDKAVLIENDNQFDIAFLEIFKGLKEADTQKVTPLKSSYSKIGADLFLVCIDWAFSDNNNKVFADFSAFYYVNTVHGQLKIFNVASHDLNNTLSLMTSFSLES
jgi:hypothetical protein